MSKIIITILMLVTLFGCNNKENQKVETINNDKTDLKEKVKTKILDKSQYNQTSKSENDSIIIENKTVLFFEPTDKSIEKLKNEIGEEDFYIATDDFTYYFNESNKFLETKNIEMLFVKNDKVLKFIDENRNETVIKLANEIELWGIYLFDPKQKPKSIDITDTPQEYNNYFK